MLPHRFELLGFIYALSSTVISVWQGVYLKMLMRTGLHKNFVHVIDSVDCRFILQRHAEQSPPLPDHPPLGGQNFFLSLPSHRRCFSKRIHPVSQFHLLLLRPLIALHRWIGNVPHGLAVVLHHQHVQASQHHHLHLSDFSQATQRRHVSGYRCCLDRYSCLND